MCYAGRVDHYWSRIAYSSISNTYDFHFNSVSPIRPTTTGVGLASQCAALTSRSGRVYLNINSMRSIGTDAYYWTNTVYSHVRTIYDFYFQDADALVSNFNAHWYGFTLRCKAD